MNKVERAFVAKQPLVFEVVDKELAIWRNPGGLDGAPVEGNIDFSLVVSYKDEKNIARASIFFLTKNTNSQIGSNNLSAGIFVRELHGPNPRSCKVGPVVSITHGQRSGLRTCTQIKDVLRFGDDRAAEQGSFHGQREHMVCHIHSILLLVVVRPPVLSWSVGVIASAIFEDIILH